MPLSSEDRKATAQSLSRGNHGHFLPKGTLKVSTSSGTDGKGDDNTLVDVKIRNPLHRITQILQDIKAHQATTVSLRFTIPLIALPIVLLVAFQLGRAQTACTQTYTSQIGTIKTLFVQVPKDEPSPLSFLLSFFPSLPKLEQKSELVNQQRTILLALQGEALQVLHDSTLNVSTYNNQTVILTGNYSACTHAITLDSPQNISPFGQ